jgi:hypothetical protein
MSHPRWPVPAIALKKVAASVVIVDDAVLRNIRPCR